MIFIHIVRSVLAGPGALTLLVQLAPRPAELSPQPRDDHGIVCVDILFIDECIV